MRIEKKHKLKALRHLRIRRKVAGTKDRPRMTVRFTQKNIHVQFVDDEAGVTLAAASTTSKSTPDRDNLSANIAGAKIMGAFAAQAALAKGIKSVVFDRAGALFHGKVKELAEAARQAGLQF